MKPHEPTVPPDTFVEQVKRALENIYDFSYLQRHPLVLSETATDRRELAGPRLRSELTAAIETLSPGADVAFRAPHARMHNLLHLRYIERMSIQEVADDLGISLRQAHRDLRRGEESIAAILWSRHAAAASEPRAVTLSSIQAEVARLDTRVYPISIQVLITQAEEAVTRLAQQRSVTFEHAPDHEQLTIMTDPVVARQVLVSLLSHAVQHTAPGVIRLQSGVERHQVTITLSYTQHERDDMPIVSQTAQQLAQHLGWTIKQNTSADGHTGITVYIYAHGPTILVIDDNEGLIELIDRYLTGHSCRVVAATSGQEGLRLAQQIVPDAIMLDVMMPETDGWNVLQHLRTSPPTADVPVIICSVFNDPELAYSLGASLVLPKPVSRDAILQALRQISVVN